LVIAAEQLQRWMTPLWQSDIIYDESVLMVADSTGSPEAGLLFEPAAIMSVRDSTMRIDYMDLPQDNIRSSLTCQVGVNWWRKRLDGYTARRYSSAIMRSQDKIPSGA